MRRTPAFAALVALVVAVGVGAGAAGLAVPDGEGTLQERSASPAPSVPSLQGAPSDTFLVLAPGQTYELPIRSTGQPLEIVVRLYNGASVDGGLTGPGTCESEPFSTNVLAISTSGQVVLRAECGAIAAGDHLLTIASGASAFTATVHLVNATFPGA